jgi:pimeloyl-ACP methyl ester carboxylesterase
MQRVPDAGHGVHGDNPHAFNEVLLRFLEGLPPRRGTAQ